MHTTNETIYDLSDFAPSLHHDGNSISYWASALTEVRTYLLNGCATLYKDSTTPTDIRVYTKLLEDMVVLVTNMSTTQQNSLQYKVSDQVYNLSVLLRFIQEQYTPTEWLNLLQGLREYMLKMLDHDNVLLYKIVIDHVDAWEHAINTITWK